VERIAPSEYTNIVNSVFRKVEGAFLNSPQFAFQNGILKLKNSTITSQKIRNHTIEEKDIDGNSITSRTIRNNSIQGKDIDSDTNIEVNEITGALITGDTGDFDTATIDNLSLITITANTIDTGQGAHELYAMDQNVLATSSPTFAGLTLNGNLVLGANTLTTSNTNLISNLNADQLDGNYASYFLNTGTNFGGDVSGIYSAIAVADDSHSHDGSTISGLTTADFTSANISQWTNDSVYITASSTLTGLVQSTAAGDSYFTGGNLGIGLNNPGTKLEIYDNAVANLLRIRTGAIEAMYVDNSGLVGIGTVVPHSKISLSGGMTVGSGYAATAMSDGNLAVEGSVGIGTSSPSQILTVQGNALISGTIQGATYGFGGMYQLGFSYEPPTPCNVANPFTGGCSCPTGFTAVEIAAVASSWTTYFCYK